MQFELCPCCSGSAFGECCEPIIAGNVNADTPLKLMRSRYTAHVCKNMPHILRTMQGKALKLFDEELTESEWFEQCKWNKLEIIDEQDNIVEFKAHFTQDGQDQVLHERSKFQKISDKWYYVSGQNMESRTVTNQKISRNDPCICGSGKKFKKCCA